MKTMIQNNKKRKLKKVSISAGMSAGGDWFRCKKCGHEIRMLVLGNFATCPECGGLMERM